MILAAFRGATRSEVKRVTFATDFDDIAFDSLDYYGWTDPKMLRRAYLLVDLPGGPVALLLNQAAVTPRGCAMCTWCNDVNLTDDAVLFTVRRGGAAGRKGDTIGALICANFGCSRNVRRLPPAYHRDTDLDLIRAEQVRDLQRRVHGFVEKVLATET